jgi:chemotaxis family two-component system sensor kinase Cph1
VGYGQLLKRSEGERLTERGNRYLDTILESAASAGTLVDDLLSFSQVGRATLTPIPIDLNGLVEEVRHRLVVDASQHPVEWRICDLPPAHADPLLLRLVIQNLLDNAIKFSRRCNPPIVEVDCTVSDKENIYRVRDNGTGFDMAYAGKLFGVFRRLHRVEEFEGTRIGLANVKRIIERHGGRVWAEGRVNSGASFFFALPISGCRRLTGWKCSNKSARMSACGTRRW